MAGVPWRKWANYKFGEFNPLTTPLFGDFYDKDIPVSNLFAMVMRQHFEHDIYSGTGPYKAIVLRVLSGPNANDRSSNSIRRTKEAYAGDAVPSMTQDLAHNNANHGPIRIIAKIPEKSVDLRLPKDIDDHRQIDLHPEFIAQRSLEADPSLASITEGSVVWVDFINPQAPDSTSGNGILIGVHDLNFMNALAEEISALKSFRDQCVLPKICTPAEAKNLYAGNTVFNFSPTAPLIRKIKGKIKTGMYGNGSEQTKAHFDEALIRAPGSFKYNIAGPTPNSKNSFIWIGHLNGNGNGKLDLIDRPPIPRETIIYAPKMLDITSPIEIKYYFHDVGGFGHSWVNGPTTTVKEAVTSVLTTDNDFRVKIGPAIKDLIRDNRNFVLVIPEMNYSRGFGTPLGDFARVAKYTSCSNTKIIQPFAGADIVRVNFDVLSNEEQTGYIVNYVKSNTIGDLTLQNIPAGLSTLKERYLHTFTHFGNMETMHDNVVEILRENLAKNISIGYVSILAEGMGALSLAAVSSARPDDLDNINLKRIDFVENGYDRANIYSLFDVEVQDPLNPSSWSSIDSVPSSYFYYTWVAQNPKRDLEFNYILEYEGAKNIGPSSSPSAGAYEFFRKIAKEKEYKSAIVPASNGLQKKFNFYLDENNNNKTNISLYIAGPPAGKSTGYAFSMINNELSSLPALGRRRTLERVGVDYVPNHAQNISSKQKAAALSVYKIEKDNLTKNIEEFENILNEITNKGIDSICKNKDYKLYCSSYDSTNPNKTIILKYGENSLFLNRYRTYLRSKERFYELEQLLEDEIVLIEVGKDKELIETRIEEYDTKFTNISNGPPKIEDVTKYLNGLKNFNSSFYTSGDGSLVITNIGTNSEQVGRRKAIKQTLDRLKEKNKTALSQCSLPEQCAKDLITLSGYSPSGEGNITDPAAFNCKNVIIEPLNDYAKLSVWIPYYPKKEDFTFDAQMTAWLRESKTEIDLDQKIETFKAKSFKYKVRRGRDTIRFVDSPPIWSCLAPVFEEAWEEACRISNYVPFIITDGIRGSYNGKQLISTELGLHVGSLGLSINVDPFIAPHTLGGMSHSVFTGAFTPGIGDNEELHNLGVFKFKPAINKLNWDDGAANIAQGGLRTIENLIETRDKNGTTLNHKPAPGAGPPSLAQEFLQNYDINSLCKGSMIVDPFRPANPTLWAITFCEKSGAKWGNGHFLKRKQNGGVWTDRDARRIGKIYGIDDIVNRIKKISWIVNKHDIHSYFQFWTGLPIIPWNTINKIAIARGLR